MTYVLGGAQTDFARNFGKEGNGLLEMLAEVVPAALADAEVPQQAVQVAHVGNLAGELFTGQAQLGGLLVAAVPGLDGIPSTRHEAACASGSTAVLAACADLESGRYDVALVVGLELMRNTDAQTAASHLGSAAWVGHEALDAKFPWPALFAEVADAYDQRYGLDREPLDAFAANAFANARRNRLAQTRDWSFPAAAFGPDYELNPLVEGQLRKNDCGRITDGAAAVLLASPRFAAEWRAPAGRGSEDRAADHRLRPPYGHLVAGRKTGFRRGISVPAPAWCGHRRVRASRPRRSVRCGRCRAARLLHDHRAGGAGAPRRGRAGQGR
nr:beta-ketoacyl synthase N-terminal-like domain-containing protein [Fodinicola feengrottensis]